MMATTTASGTTGTADAAAVPAPSSPRTPGDSTLAAPATLPLWTAAHLDGFPQPLDDTRYEIIDGELHVSTQPSYQHQLVGKRVSRAIDEWSESVGEAESNVAPGVVFAERQAVAPDVVWVSRLRLPAVLGDDGKLHAAPDLVVEVLSPGSDNAKRDRETKALLYSQWGVHEYWLLDWRARSAAVYRRRDAALHVDTTLYEEDSLQSPLLPGFSCPLQRLFAHLP
jgi:Uma2 family endonuclease